MNLGYCKILGCDSKKRDSNRNFFKIPTANKVEWVKIIRSYQPEVLLDFDSKILICDKHFNSEDILTVGIDRKKLRCGALPKLVPQDEIDLIAPNANDAHNEEDEIFDSLTIQVDEIELHDEMDLVIQDTNDDQASEREHDIDDGKTTISVQVFNKLAQDSVELIKAIETILQLQNIIQNKESKINTLTEQVKQKQENTTYNSETAEILACLRNGRPDAKYSPVIRDFSLALRYHSTGAYNFIRSKFNNHLPAVRTIQKWCESVNGSPGISLDALEAIRKAAELYASENEGKEMPVCVISDEMTGRTDACWQSYKKEFMGFSEYVNLSKDNTEENDNKLPFARNILVFMVAGPNFKIPVGYHLLAGLDSVTRAALTNEVIVRVNQTGVRTMTLTSDGLPANITVAKELGADFVNNKPYFTSPTNPNHKIYIIWDPSHLIKIARGRLAEAQLFHNGKPLKWNLIKSLHELQKQRNFNLGNKLSDLHTNYKGKKMNVRIAAQTLSREVAEGLLQLHDDRENGFEDVDEEVEYMCTIRNLFDVMNYKEKERKNGNTDNPFKVPICRSTADELFQYFDKATSYLESLEIEVESKGITSRKLLSESQSFMTVFGFKHNMTSIKGLYEDFIETNLLDKLITFQFSQDHLETWFSSVRRALGSNDNPSALEFSYIFRKLLICHQFVYNGQKSNCKIDRSFAVLSVPARSLSKIEPDISKVSALEVETDYHTSLAQPLSCFDEHLDAHTASTVENVIIQRMKCFKKKECSRCRSVFDENIKVQDDFMKRNSMMKKLDQPCQSTVNIIKVANIITNMLSNACSYLEVQKTIFVTLDTDDLYKNTKFDEHSDENNISTMISHKEKFILKIIDVFMDIKSQNIGKRIVEAERGEYIRHSLRKKCHLAGQ